MRRYTGSGLLPDTRSLGGRRIFRVRDIEALVVKRAGTKGKAAVLYARVSSRRQEKEGDLARQQTLLRAAARQCEVVGEFTDVASGLSDKRVGLRHALDLCWSGGVRYLYVTHDDRLARFGTGLLRASLARVGTEIVCIGQDQPSSPESELVHDMLAVVTCFSGRLYGQRSAKARAAVKALQTATTTSKTP